MKTLLMLFRRRLEELRSAEEKTLNQIKDSPEGSLRVANNDGFVRYYHVTQKNGKNGKYIRNESRDLACALAQKDYNTRLLRSIQKEKTAIVSFLNNYPGQSPEDVYSDLAPARKMLVSAAFMEGKDLAEKWLSQSFEANPSFPEEKVFATKRGEFVRSKSEAMIADAYFDMGIPYKYDYPVEVEPGRYRYVDFAVLDVRNGKVFYHEHLGRVDDPDYLRKNMRKIKEYQRIKIFSGKNLMLTLETEEFPLDMSLFRQNVAELFGKA